MVKVMLTEGFNAYICRNGMVVMPSWDAHGAQLIGQCRVLIPGGIQVVLKEVPRDTAEKIEADIGGLVQILGES